MIGGKPGPLEVEPARAEVGIGGMWESLVDKDDLCINQHQLSPGVVACSIKYTKKVKTRK